MNYNHHNKGVASELIAMKYYALQGYDIFPAIGHQNICDFVAVKGVDCLRIQVKTAYRAKRSIQICTARNKNSSKPIPYTKEDCDIIFAVLDENFWVIPVEDVKNRQVMTLNSA